MPSEIIGSLPGPNVTKYSMIRRMANRIQRLGLGGTLKSFYHGGRYLVYRDLLNRDYLCRPILDFEMVLRIGDKGLSRELATSGVREAQLKYVIDRYLEPGSTILDLGANIGYYTLIMANRIGSTGYIYALEPAPDNYALLRKNIALNHIDGQVSTYQIGASNREGVERFYLSKYSNMHTFVPRDSGSSTIRADLSGEYIDVPMVDLSSFIKGKRKIDLLRMDIEGFEVEVFQGLQAAIAAGDFDADMVFEVHRSRYDENRSMVKQMINLFDHGYRARVMTSNDDSRSRLREFYQPVKLCQTNDALRFRGIYENVTNEHVIEFLADYGGVRDILLSKRV